MAKRFADKELTHDNWDQEQEEEEEAGVFRTASKEVLERREIKKAKRRGVTDEKGGAGAFKGFSFGATTTAAGSLDSRPFSFSMQPNSMTSESTSKPPFGGYSGAAPTVTSVAAPVSVASVVSKSGSSKTSGDSDTESQYRHRLRTLNESVLRWIDDHIKTSPYCILTPIFHDYEEYIKELDRDFPKSFDKVVGKAPVATTAAAAAGFSFPSSSVGTSSTVSSCAVITSQTSTSATVVAGLFRTGTTAANSDGKPFGPPTSTTAVTTGVSACGLTGGTLPSIGATSSGLNLGAQSSLPASSYSFGAQLLKQATKTSGYSFGAQPSKEPTISFAPKDANSHISGFNFGTQPSKGLATSLVVKDPNSPISGFSFGTQPSKGLATSLVVKDPNSPISGFSFGTQPSKGLATSLVVKDPNSPISGFSFGTQPSKGLATSLVVKDPNSPISGFSFGTQPSKGLATSLVVKDPNSPISGFSFGTQPSKDLATSLVVKDPNSPISGFSFGTQPSKDLATSLVVKDPHSPISGFSFGTQPSKELATSLEAKDSNSPIPGFNFGAQQSKEATAAPQSSSTPAVASTSAGGEDDNYVPPNANVVDIKEDDAFYTVRCKLYYKIEEGFKERGIGNLYLKPCGEKTQLLVRSETTLGNILLNIMLHKNIRTSCQGLNVVMVCVPNPPLDENKPNDKTPVVMLLHVKTEEDAKTLLKQIDDHK